MKALGRCNKRHVQVVDYPAGTMPTGECKTCGDALIEWAVKLPTKESE